MRVSGVPVTTTYPCDIKPQPIDKLRAVLPRQKQKQTEEKTQTKSHLYKKGGKKKRKKKKCFEPIVCLRVEYGKATTNVSTYAMTL